MNDLLSPVYGALKQPSMVDFRGHLSSVFFTSGCNFHCCYCHNQDLLCFRRDLLSWNRLTQMCQEFRENWVDGAVITGGEPTLNSQLRELISFLKGFGFMVKLDTNGSRSDVLHEVMPHLDYVAMDLKCPLEDYPEFAGFDDTDSILKSVALLKTGSTPYELRTTVIQGIHTEEQMKKLTPIVSGAQRYVLQPFVPRDEVPDEKLREFPRTPAHYLEQIGELFKDSVEELICH